MIYKTLTLKNIGLFMLDQLTLIKKMHFRNSELICELSDLSQTLKDSMEYHMDTNSECIHNLALIRIIHDKMLELHKKDFDIGIRINEILMK